MESETTADATHGPYLNGRYGIGLVVWTSQSGYGEAVGLLKSEGIHSAETVSGSFECGKCVSPPGFLSGFCIRDVEDFLSKF
jgi:hypothetical protein